MKTDAPQQRGFTLLELLITMAVISIIVMIAMPVYLDYRVRSKVSEAFSLATRAFTSVSETAVSNDWPENNEQAGLPEPIQITGSHVLRARLLIPEMA